MKGIQKVSVHNRRLTYQFALRRNITVIKGDSATGKTTLYELIESYTRLGQSSGVTLECEKRCVALVDIDWINQLASTHDSIVFIDEGFAPLSSKEFASAIKATDNYYVLFTREDLHELPYSVEEIYKIKTSGKRMHTLEPLYRATEQHCFAISRRRRVRSDYDTLIVEDSKAGYQFYESRFEDTDVTCKSAGNNAGIYRMLMDDHSGPIFVIADGAAFGCEAERVLKLQAAFPTHITVCLPESFEWLVVKSKLVSADDIDDVIANPSDHIESERYFSWEQYFTAYLQDITKGTPFSYRKSTLAEAYKLPQNAEKILAEIADRNIR